MVLLLRLVSMSMVSFSPIVTPPLKQRTETIIGNTNQLVEDRQSSDRLPHMIMIY